ncbi:GDSL-lipase 1 [Heracleum sosnowskyi]|uniref:GDSL-lipase 1 n=1 Tax=Heracleum sosnowskyi TaxID=360622 RepID=A0AAD8HK92_9APIA|nr:GDSL-lipase 1 [Heracleum sosnowskyi]
MAIELNKNKYWVLCAMLILLNHHINEAEGLEALAQAPANGYIAVAPGTGSKAPTSQVSNSGSIGVEAPTLGRGFKADQAPRPKYKSKPLISVLPNKITDNGTKSGEPQVPCFMIFGDSLVDVGNNNILKTWARADYSPYGIDFKPFGPTGRFCNGRTTVDFIAELLGFDHYIPPSELTNGTDILQGLNFASAAAGIREETAQHLGDRSTMKEQIDNFKNKILEMNVLLGGPQNTRDHLGKCLFQVGFGSNDYLNNYFLPSVYNTSKLFTPEQYADDLIKQFTTLLLEIYDLGARKFALAGVSQVGCSPNSLALGSQDGTCVKTINDANEMFNTRLKTLVDTLNKDHPDAKFTYINSYGLFQELKDRASTLGFKNTNEGCCGVGKFKGLITCLPTQIPCPNRDEYLFWDAYHPTEATNRIGARRSYIKLLPTDAYPYDIRTLITLK